MRQSTTLLAALIPLLSACAVGTGIDEAAVFHELQKRLEASDFEMVSPPRGDYRPGTALDIGATNTVTLCHIEDTADAMNETPALFMNDFTMDNSTEVGLRAVAALGGDPLGQTASASAELKRRGVQQIRMRFKECTIQSLSLSKLQGFLDALPPAQKRDFENGAEVIVEALVASGTELAFTGQTEDVAALGVRLLGEITGGRAEVKQTHSSEFSVAVAGKICLGMKTRTLFTDEAGEAVAALELPRDLVTKLREARGIMRPDLFRDVGNRFQELRQQWFNYGACVDYRNQVQNDIRLLNGVAQALESEARAMQDRQASQPLTAKVKAMRKFADLLIHTANDEIRDTNKRYQQGKKGYRLDRVTR